MSDLRPQPYHTDGTEGIAAQGTAGKGSQGKRPETAAQAQKGLTLRIIVAVLIALVIVGALVGFYTDLKTLKDAASTFAPSALVIALLLAAGNYAVRIVRWQYYLRHLGIRIPLGESSVVFLCGFVMSVTPGKVGEVFKSLLLQESRGIPFSRTAPIVVAERLTDFIALVMLISLGSFAFEHGAAVAGLSATMVAFLILVCAYRPLGRFLLGLADRLPLVSRVSPKLHEAYDSLLEMTRPAPLLIGSTVAFVAWAMECGSLYAIVHGFPGVQMSARAATFAYSASTIAGAVAMMPGGLGVTEVGMTALLRSLGGAAMQPAVATASTILVRIATLWFAVAIGLIALMVHRAMQRALHRKTI